MRTWKLGIMKEKHKDELDWDVVDPVKPGYVRVYTDHTGRWYQDYTQEEYDKIINHPFMVILREEIQKEINKEVIRLIRSNGKNE